jgi:hypothetical protein
VVREMYLGLRELPAYARSVNEDPEARTRWRTSPSRNGLLACISP